MSGTNGRRLGLRTPTQARGRIFDSAGRGVDVAIKDISSTGARLLVSAEAAVPREFLIRFGEYEARGEVVWRKGPDMGIRFILPDEDEGRVRPQAPTPVRKATIDELRSATRPRRGMMRFLFG